jgi:hypothetical protein
VSDPKIEYYGTNAATITDEQCHAVHTQLPYSWVKSLLDGALGVVEPHRNHSRYELAKLWCSLVCPHCTPRERVENHVTGAIFVGWGHGWQPCQHCGGSGLAKDVVP